MKIKKIAVIGGGPAGMIAAAKASQCGADVTLFEQNSKLGKKLYITGKGRCNVTNACDRDVFLQNVVSNPKFLFSAYAELDSFSAMQLIEKDGDCPLITERGRRVFPQSGKSSDIIKAFSKICEKNGVKINYNMRCVDVAVSENGFKVSFQQVLSDEKKLYYKIKTTGKTIIKDFDYVILCGGGLSYSVTGSDGSLYAIAEKLGHTIVKPAPSICRVKTHEDLSELAGLTLKNVKLSAVQKKKVLYEEMGELLFTHDGVSGPLVLSASAYINRQNLSEIEFYIDLKPAVTAEMLDQRLVREFTQFSASILKNYLAELLPKSLIPFIIKTSGVPENTRCNSITVAQRRAIIEAVKCLKLRVLELDDIDRAVVTAGGISVKQIDARTMESKLVSGLFFAGEIIDVDALTGGYNIQIAMSTGALAGVSAGNKIKN